MMSLIVLIKMILAETVRIAFWNKQLIKHGFVRLGIYLLEYGQMLDSIALSASYILS